MDPYKTVNERKVPPGTYPPNVLDMVSTMQERKKRTKSDNQWEVTSYVKIPDVTGNKYRRLRDVPLPRLQNAYYASNSGAPPRPRF